MTDLHGPQTVVTDCQSNLYDHAPGNGTRYKVLITDVDPQTNGADTLVTVVAPDVFAGSYPLWRSGGHLNAGYFLSKFPRLRGHPADALAVIELVASVIDRELDERDLRDVLGVGPDQELEPLRR